MSIGDGTHYVVMGRPESGYSLKVRGVLRYKGIAHEWVDRCLRNQKLFQAHAQVQLIPLVFRPDGSSFQDSTPILEELERDYPEPSLHPPEPASRFVSELLEEYADEWVNKLMFQYRWGHRADQKHRSGTLARGMLEGHPLRPFAPLMARLTVRRMVPRMAFAGANENNAPLLEESFHNLVALLEAHLDARPYVFGGRPAFGDFGLWGQLYQSYIDPTCGSHMNAHAPAVVAWLERMLEPKSAGPFEPFASLEPTLGPILGREVGPRFLAWSGANARAWEAGEERTELTMDSRRYYQKTFKYPARTLEILREKCAAVADDAELARFLEANGCWRELSSAPGSPASAAAFSAPPAS